MATFSMKCTLEIDVDEVRALSNLIGLLSKSDYENKGIANSEQNLLINIYKELIKDVTP